MLTSASPAPELPDDVAALKAIILAERARIERLERLVEAFKQALYARKSEKIDPDQFELALEDIAIAIAAVEAEQEAGGKPHQPATRQRRQANRASLPRHLPRVERVIEPEHTTCECGCQMHAIGEDVSERLDIVPAQIRVIVTRRPKYACRACETGVRQAPAPAHLIAGGLPTEATLAHVLVGKYADHLPLYRQVQILARHGVELDRSTLADWVGRTAFELRPVYEALLADLKGSTKLFMDETRAPVLDPGRRRTKTGYLWALARDERPWSGADPPGVAYCYAPGRGGEHAERFLAGFSGVLQVDGYSGYNRLTRPDRDGGPIELAYCWAHARRKLFEIARGRTAPVAAEGLRRIGELYQIEAAIRGRTADERFAARREHAIARVDAFGDWVEEQRVRVSRKSPLGEALSYIFKLWTGLNVYLSDGRVEIDSNCVERAIRPIALNRKNALFAGHDAGGENWGIMASLIETAKLNSVEPFAYLRRTLEAIAHGHRQSRIDELLPWNCPAPAAV